MKKYYFQLAAIIVFGVLAVFSFGKNSEENEISYPEGYRFWTHIKTGLVGPTNPNFQTNGGYHHIYANEKAMEGYKTGKFPEGSVIVFDLLNIKEQNGNFQEAERKHLDVMVKDSGKFAETGGWGFEEFKGDSHTERAMTLTTRTQCSNCHAKQDDYVFSEFRK